MKGLIPASRHAILIFYGFMVFVLSLLWGVVAVKAEGSRQHYYEELSKVPEKGRSRPNPMEGDLDAVAAGRKLFEHHCLECHGRHAEGGRKGPSLRVREVRTATSGALFWILTNGVVRRGMPVWSKLPEPQRWQIVSYLKSLN